MWTEDGPFCSMCRGKMLPYHKRAGAAYGCVTCDLLVPSEHVKEWADDGEA
jgi:hypothetical protein